MSHNIDYFTYHKDVNKEKVQKNLDNYVAHADWQEGCGGLYKNIRWLGNTVYGSQDEAREAIRKMDKGNYDQIAVLFNEYYEPQDEKINELRAKASEACKEWSKRDQVLYADTVTSTYIGCKHCGSRLFRELLQENLCPVCRSELRPEHMLKSISSAKNKWVRAQRSVEEYIQKKCRKETMWLVKIEYHT